MPLIKKERTSSTLIIEMKIMGDVIANKNIKKLFVFFLFFIFKCEWSRQGSNLRSARCKRDVITTRPRDLNKYRYLAFKKGFCYGIYFHNIYKV